MTGKDYRIINIIIDDLAGRGSAAGRSIWMTLNGYTEI